MTRWLSQLRAAFRSIVHHRRAERELEDEMRSHLQLEIEAQRNAGLTPHEARYAALHAMGPIEKSKEECRDLRQGRLVSEFLRDLRYAGRALRRRPGSATLAIASVSTYVCRNVESACSPELGVAMDRITHKNFRFGGLCTHTGSASDRSTTGFQENTHDTLG